MKRKFVFIIFSLLIAFTRTALSQTSVLVQGYAMPSVLSSTEDFYFEYFGDNKIQPMIQYGGRVGIAIKSHWQFNIGFSFHKRKMSTDCLFIPREGVDIVQSYMAQTRTSICTHTSRRDYSIIEMPVLLSYKLKTVNKFTPYFSVGFSPLKKVSYKEVMREIAIGDIANLKRSYSSELDYLIYSNLAVGTNYSFSKKMSFICEAAYRVDDKTFKDNTFGLAVGLGYEIGKTKRR